MAKADKENELRTHGMLYILEIGRKAQKEGKDPLAAMDEEIRYRGLTKVSIAVKREDVDECIDRVKDSAVDTIKALSVLTLVKHLHFSEFFCQKYICGFNEETEPLAARILTWDDILNKVYDETGIKLHIRKND